MPDIEITKEEYEKIKNKELEETNLNVYEFVEVQQDADDIISSLQYEDLGDQILVNAEGEDYVYVAPDNSLYVDTTEPISQSTSVSPGISFGAIPVSCAEIQTNFNKNLKISEYFTLGEVAVYFDRLKDKSVGGKYYTKYQISCNLKSLAVNVLDKIKKEFPDMYINSSIRNWGSRSEHETGQAADLLFFKHKKSEYYNIVLWIHQNIGIYNQLFLEYRPSSNPRGGWIHVSYADPKNQTLGAPKTWATLYNDKSDPPGAKRSFVNVMSNSNWIS